MSRSARTFMPLDTPTLLRCPECPSYLNHDGKGGFYCPHLDEHAPLIPPGDARIEAGAEALFRHFNHKYGYEWPAPEQHLPWWRDAARAVIEAADKVAP